MKNRFEHCLKDWKPRKKIPYKGRVWNIKELLIHLANKVEKLNRNQCKPRAGCLHKYHEYMEKKYINNKI